MIKRTVEFTVGDGVITPSIPQYGGVKGEHNATGLKITLPSGLYSAGDVARLSFTTGDGTVLSSDILDVTALGTYIEYELPQLLTIAAGQLCVRVVVSHMENGEETQTYRSPEMVLYFEEASVENGTPFWTGVSEMLHRTATASMVAVDAQEAAVDAQGKAENAANTAAENIKEQLQEYVTDAETAQDAAVDAQGAAKKAQEAAARAANSAWEAVDTPGRRGASAYEVAVENGFEGDEAAWLKSLKGKDGDAVDGERLVDLESRIAETETDTQLMRVDIDTNTKNINNLIQERLEIGKEIRQLTLRVDAIEAEDTFCYKGKITGASLAVKTDQQVGDVWFVEGSGEQDNRFYMWDGTEWAPLGSGGTISDADKASIVKDVLAALPVYDGEVVTV